MSNKEMKDGLQEDTSGVSDENTGCLLYTSPSPRDA